MAWFKVQTHIQSELEVCENTKEKTQHCKKMGLLVDLVTFLENSSYLKILDIVCPKNMNVC
jgi:hypothetical protein